MDKTNSIITNINEFVSSHKGELIGAFLIKIDKWKISNFIPILFLDKENIFILIDKSVSKIPLNSIVKLELNNNIIKIFCGEEVELSLVDPSGNFNKISKSYTQTFFSLVSILEKENNINTNLLAQLPNQINIKGVSTKGIFPIIFGVLLFALSFLMLAFSPPIGVFGILSGILIISIGAFQRFKSILFD